ncbi:MAG: aminoacyl-tRNA hydrolase [Kiritimatiellia bacterium]
MKLVLGLGNPGRRYVRTPHNAGYSVIDELARVLACKLRKSIRFKARIGKTVRQSQELWLVKPETYMNRSGLCAGRVLKSGNTDPENMIVAVDDADLEPGRLRIRPSGGSGGHKGLSSIIENVGTSAFPRVRIGIGRSSDRDLTSHVLGPLSEKERKITEQTIKMAADAVLCIISDGIEAAMNRYNGEK